MRALLLGVIQWLNDNGWSFNVLIFSSFLFFLWSKFAVSNYKFERLILFFLGIVSLTLLSSESLQIRFVYPVFIFFKVFFVFYFIMQGNNQRRKGIHVRFNQS